MDILNDGRKNVYFRKGIWLSQICVMNAWNTKQQRKSYLWTSSSKTQKKKKPSHKTNMRKKKNPNHLLSICRSIKNPFKKTKMMEKMPLNLWPKKKESSPPDNDLGASNQHERHPIPSRQKNLRIQWGYPPGDGYISHQTGKGKSSTQNAILGGYVSFLEGSLNGIDSYSV